MCQLVFDFELELVILATSKQFQHLPIFSRLPCLPGEKTLHNQIHSTENQIDVLVYQLYGLTPEEIAIVEGA